MLFYLTFPSITTINAADKCCHRFISTSCLQLIMAFHYSMHLHCRFHLQRLIETSLLDLQQANTLVGKLSRKAWEYTQKAWLVPYLVIIISDMVWIYEHGDRNVVEFWNLLGMIHHSMSVDNQYSPLFHFNPFFFLIHNALSNLHFQGT